MGAFRKIEKATGAPGGIPPGIRASLLCRGDRRTRRLDRPKGDGDKQEVQHALPRRALSGRDAMPPGGRIAVIEMNMLAAVRSRQSVIEAVAR